MHMSGIGIACNPGNVGKRSTRQAAWFVECLDVFIEMTRVLFLIDTYTHIYIYIHIHTRTRTHTYIFDIF